MNIWLIHCAGKVASVSIANALVDAGMETGENRIFKTHVINAENKSNHSKQAHASGHLASSEAFLDLYASDRYDKCYVITGQRDPVGQAISAFFQNIPIYMGKEHLSCSDLYCVLSRLYEKIDFITKYITTTWWKSQFEDFFGNDPFKFDFDKAAGISCVEESRKLIFVFYTVERGLILLPKVLEMLSGKMPISIGHRNSVADSRHFKPYNNPVEIAEIYASVMKQFRLPRATLQTMYDRESVRFFYDQTQIEGFIQRWQR